MDDRRRYKRFSATCVALLSADDPDQRINAQLVDISFSGICVVVQEPLNVGAELMIELHDTGFAAEPMRLGKGEVLYVDSAQPASAIGRKAGIRFTVPDVEVIERLLQRIQTRSFSESKWRQRTSKQHLKDRDVWF
jgi:c-di-GMP-binding flagellar brake protein YcgR